MSLSSKIISLSTVPIAATIIYIEFRGDLHKCCVGCERWMLSFIIIGFILIASAITEKYRNSDNNKQIYIIPLFSIAPIVILWTVALILLIGPNSADVCRKTSPYVFIFMPLVFLIPLGIIIVILFLYPIYMCLRDIYLICYVIE